MKTKTLYAAMLMAAAALPLATLSTGCGARHYETAEGYVDDKALSMKIKTQLARDPIAKATDINVTTYNREVQLSGFVGRQDEKTRAAQIAASVPGVVSVHNNLIVRTGR